MPNWGQHDIHPHMHVYSSDNQDIGHVAEVYEDSFLVRKGYFFPKDRYIPYSAIANVEDDRVQLTMTADEAVNGNPPTTLSGMSHWPVAALW